jgi:Ca2+-transporting ATPase
LQLKLNRLAELIAKLGAAAGLVLFVALMIRFFVQLHEDPGRTADAKGQQFVQILIIAVTVVVVAVPEGLPLAVTLALAFATKRMAQANLLVRVLSSCETMANSTVVCTDKTGTLTQNEMTVVAGSVGVHCKFVRRLEENAQRSNANKNDDGEAEGQGGDDKRPTIRNDFAVDQDELSQVLSPRVRRLMNDSITINSTAFEGADEGGNVRFVGSKTETALLAFAKHYGWQDYREVREQADVVQVIPFSSERKAMGVVVRRAGGKGYRLFLKGASEVLARRCGKHIVVPQPGSESAEQDAGDDEGTVDTVDFDADDRSNIDRTIMFYAGQSLRTLALCTRDFPAGPWPPTQTESGDEMEYDDLASDLTLVAITAIEDPLRKGVVNAVGNCQKAGVAVKMVTGDNVLTARFVLARCFFSL